MTPLDPKSRVALKKIMLATDFSPQSEAALPYALTIARQYGSELFVAHVISPGFADRVAPESTPRISQEAQELNRQNMERILSAGREWGVSCQPLIAEILRRALIRQQGGVSIGTGYLKRKSSLKL